MYQFGVTKYGKGRHVQGVWVLGGVEINTEGRNMFATIVDDRSAVTLNSHMVKYIARGSIVSVDCWKGYKPKDFEDCGWEYQSVNHEECWVDPVTGTTTNAIEGNWTGFKTTAPRRAYNKRMITPYLLFHIWKRRHRGKWWPRLLYALGQCDWNQVLLENEREDVDVSLDDFTVEEKEEEDDQENDEDNTDELNAVRTRRAQSQIMSIQKCQVKHGNFTIKGHSNKTLYTVTIGEWPSCSCPDFSNNHLCKHIKAVLMKKYNVGETSGLLKKRRFTDADLTSLGITANWICRDNPYLSQASTLTEMSTSSSTSPPSLSATLSSLSTAPSSSSSSSSSVSSLL